MGLGPHDPPIPLTAAKHCSNVAHPQLVAPPLLKIVIGAPRIVLGLGACSNADDTDANSRHEQQEPHNRLLRRHIKLLTTRGHAWNVNIRPPCWITNPAPRVRGDFCRGRGESRTALNWPQRIYQPMTAYLEMFAVMNIALSQCWGCNAHGGNCSAKNQL
jgi:hypothetical protein